MNVSYLVLRPVPQGFCAAISLSIDSSDYTDSFKTIKKACKFGYYSVISDLCAAVCVIDFCYELATKTVSDNEYDDDDLFALVYHTCVGEYIANSKQYIYTMYGYINQCLDLQCHYDPDDTDDSAGNSDEIDIEEFLDILTCCIQHFSYACFASSNINEDVCLDSPYDLCRQLALPNREEELLCNMSISYIIADSLESLCLSNVESCVSQFSAII